jgi:glycosyltransferase involved in cell wall biosynthesis
MKPGKILLFANTDWYLYNFRRSLAEKLRESGWQVVLVSPPGDYGHRLQELGFRWIPFEFSTGSTNPFAELLVIFRLIALYRRERPALVHHFTIKCVLYGSLAARLAGVVRIVNAVTGLGHIFTNPGIKARLLRPVVSAFYRFVLGNKNGRVIFQNEDDLNTFVNQRLVPRPLARLIRGSGVNCDRFRSGDNSGQIAGEPPKVLFASRLLWEKGLKELLEAIRIIKGRGIAAEFIVAGDIYPGNPSSLTQEDIDAIRKEGLVTCLGHVDTMTALLDTCDLVVLPSYREGTPRILIEAAAMGKAIVATDIPGCRGLVRDGVNGLLVPCKSAAALAEALEILIPDVSRRRKFGLAGREIVKAEFSEDIVIHKTFDVYGECLHI